MVWAAGRRGRVRGPGAPVVPKGTRTGFTPTTAAQASTGGAEAPPPYVSAVQRGASERVYRIVGSSVPEVAL